MLKLVNLRSIKLEHKQFLREHHRNVRLSLIDAERAAVDANNNRQGFITRTGKTQRATRVMRRGKRTIIFRVSSSHPNAWRMEKGTRPHVIKAKSGKSLRFEMGGKIRFFKKVNHPGTRPYRFLSRARNTAGSVFERQMKIRMIRSSFNF